MHIKAKGDNWYSSTCTSYSSFFSLCLIEVGKVCKVLWGERVAAKWVAIVVEWVKVGVKGSLRLVALTRWGRSSAQRGFVARLWRGRPRRWGFALFRRKGRRGTFRTAVSSVGKGRKAKRVALVKQRPCWAKQRHWALLVDTYLVASAISKCIKIGKIVRSTKWVCGLGRIEGII